MSLPLPPVLIVDDEKNMRTSLKTVLAGHDDMGTLVFDEIDANVGGRLGDILGQKLAALGRTHQIICVTHLPQVASYARNQWTIRKSKRGKRTTTTIELLDESQRLDELASMLRGDSKGEAARRHGAGRGSGTGPRGVGPTDARDRRSGAGAEAESA